MHKKMSAASYHIFASTTACLHQLGDGPPAGGLVLTLPNTLHCICQPHNAWHAGRIVATSSIGKLGIFVVLGTCAWYCNWRQLAWFNSSLTSIATSSALPTSHHWFSTCQYWAHAHKHQLAPNKRSDLQVGTSPESLQQS